MHQRSPSRVRIPLVLCAIALPFASFAALHARQWRQEPLHELVAILLQTTPDRLIVGDLPGDAPFDRAALEGMRLVGSLSVDGLPSHAVIAVDGDLHEARMQLRDRLLDAEFTPFPAPGVTHGFLQTRTRFTSISLCKGPVWLHDESFPAPNAPTGGHLRLTWIRQDAGACSGQTTGFLQPDMMSGNPLPGLVPPTDVRVEITGANAGPSGVSSHAALTTNRSLGSLMAHYSAELERAGARLAEPLTAPFASSRPFAMTVRDAEWEGEIVLTRSERNAGPSIHAVLRMWPVR